jgi:hypothetical protein
MPLRPDGSSSKSCPVGLETVSDRHLHLPNIGVIKKNSTPFSLYVLIKSQSYNLPIVSSLVQERATQIPYDCHCTI